MYNFRLHFRFHVTFWREIIRFFILRIRFVKLYLQTLELTEYRKVESRNEEHDIDLDDLSDKLDEKNDDLDISDNEETVEVLEEEIKQRPKGNTALSYCSHLKQLILRFTENEFDISNKLQFPKFYVSIFNFKITWRGSVHA